MKQLQVKFTGNVQGVGFRFATKEVARRFKVTGFVKNETDGSVTVLAEGDEAELQHFFRELKESRLSEHFRDVQARWENSEGRWKEFSIAF